MKIHLKADDESTATTVSVEDVRKFVEDLHAINENLKEAKQELKKVLDGNTDFEALVDTAKAAKEAVKLYLETNLVVKKYIEDIEKIKEDKKDIIDEARDRGVPQKEVAAAIKMLKQDIDPDSTTEIYANISDLVG
jgi:uncharacterized protein (UPF0335 family)